MKLNELKESVDKLPDAFEKIADNVVVIDPYKLSDSELEQLADEGQPPWLYAMAYHLGAKKLNELYIIESEIDGESFDELVGEFKKGKKLPPLGYAELALGTFRGRAAAIVSDHGYSAIAVK